MLTANQIHQHAHVCGRFQNWNQLVEKKFTSKVKPLKSAGFMIDNVNIHNYFCRDVTLQ